MLGGPWIEQDPQHDSEEPKPKSAIERNCDILIVAVGPANEIFALVTDWYPGAVAVVLHFGSPAQR